MIFDATDDRQGWLNPPPMVPLLYGRARDRFVGINGLWVLARPTSIEGRAIVAATYRDELPPWQQYSHVTIAGWMCLPHNRKPSFHRWELGEAMQRRGQRKICFSAEVEKWPGYYDLYRPVGDAYDGDKAWSLMSDAAGAEYDTPGCVLLLKRRLHLAPAWQPSARENSADMRQPRFCSELIAALSRLAGGPLVKRHDGDVSPTDLTDPKFASYIGTLYWTQEQADRAKYTECA